MVSKKIISTTVGIIGIVFIILNIVYFYNASAFYNNIIHQSKFETKNFIIDLPKFHWFGVYANNSTETILFLGVPVKIECLIDKFKPIIILDNFTNDILEDWNVLCDISLEKSTQKINNAKVDKYTCVSSKHDTFAMFIAYKDELFRIYTYNSDELQLQYDKFFESVRLKE
ncbi:MAG: hypothetical protein LBG21_06710 [Campylobacteraceae bacterium]|jgi:hypothetical protein|nr:hypothetical protein [Campylobacteraceae bacterium]